LCATSSQQITEK